MSPFSDTTYMASGTLFCRFPEFATRVVALKRSRPRARMIIDCALVRQWLTVRCPGRQILQPLNWLHEELNSLIIQSWKSRTCSNPSSSGCFPNLIAKRLT